MKRKIRISDLFQGPYNHSKRLEEQIEFYNRLMVHSDDKIIKEIADITKEFNELKIASIIQFEAAVAKLTKHGVEIE